MRLRESRSVFRELVRDLMEADNKGTPDNPLSGDSVDKQIDKFLLAYEKESQQKKNESYDFRKSTMSFLLEADDDQSSDKDSNTDLDVDLFASATMRLVTNYDSLLDIKNAILKRAHNFIMKNYDMISANQFVDIMRHEHDIEIDKTQYDKEKDIKPPDAARSGGASVA